jgi:AAA domain
MSTRVSARIGRRQLFKLAEDEGRIVICDTCERALDRNGRCLRCDDEGRTPKQAPLSKVVGNDFTPDGWEPVDLAPILAGESIEAPPSVLVRTDGQGLLYPGKVHALAGPPESVKGWLALVTSAERMALGEHVLYIDFEDTAATAVARLRALGVPDSHIFGLFHYVAPEDPLRGDIRDLVPEGTGLAVLDGITEALTLLGLKLIDNTDVAKFLGMVARPLAAAGPAVLMLDHVVKDREARGRGAIGAQHKLAGVDVAYSLDIIRPFGRGLEGLSRLTITKDRPGFIRAHATGRKLAGDVELVSEGSEVAVVVKPVMFEDQDPLGLRPAERRVLEALLDQPPGSFPRDIGDRVVEQGWEAGLARETIQRALRSLEKHGLAEGAEGRWWRCDQR